VSDDDLNNGWRSEKDDLLRKFDTDGYVMLPGFLSGEQVAELRENLNRFIAESVPNLPANHVFYEDRAKPETLKQMQNLHTYDPYFGRMTIGSEFEDLASVLMRDAAVPKNLQYFNKPAGVGKPTPAHQDGYYFMLSPCVAVTMWLALEKVDEENGCVRYIPGSHRQGMRAHQRTDTLGFSQGIADYGGADSAAEVMMPAEPGDLLVHHAFTIHRADGNGSANRTRKAMGFVYFGAQAKVDEAARDAYQKKLTREMKAAGKI
jgi:phytanoyl-CoA hydroxylase